MTAEKADLVAQLNQARREVESMQGGGISSKVRTLFISTLGA